MFPLSIRPFLRHKAIESKYHLLYHKIDKNAHILCTYGRIINNDYHILIIYTVNQFLMLLQLSNSTEIAAASLHLPYEKQITRSFHFDFLQCVRV